MGISFVFFLVAIPSFLFSHFPCVAHAAAESELVKGVCHEAQNSSFCVQVLESDPKTPSAKNYMDLAVIALNLGISYSTATRNYIDRLYKNPKTDPRMKSTMKTCLIYYNGAVIDFKLALKALKANDPLSANYTSKIAGDNAVYCSTAMASDGFKDSTIADGNFFTSNFSDIAFVITNHIE